MKFDENKLSWQEVLETRMNRAPFLACSSHFKLSQFQRFPEPQQLNQLVENLVGASANIPEFKENQHFINDRRYYEEIICQSNEVPTRENSWHDFFNALIWMQFPQTKRMLSELHQKDIAQFGLNPRTRRRNHITHFDECGVILAIPESQIERGNELLISLANHQWKYAFLNLKENWERAIYPVVFGHAMLEMMLQPFIGLTAKWLAVSVPDDFTQLSFWQRNCVLDKAILKKVHLLNDFDIKHPLKPLPILGVPDWHAEQSEMFYSDKNYFRPLLRQNEWPEYILL